jgi:hypothetical protein
MSAVRWVVDALLGSPIPSPNWLDPRHRGAAWRAPGASWAGGLPVGRYHVSGARVAVELAELNTCVNPPVIQGWAWCLALIGAAVTLLGVRDLGVNGPGDGRAILMIFTPIPAWCAAVLLGGFFSHDVELRDGVVYVRRWTDVWFGRQGKVVGPVETLHAVLSCGDHVQMAGEAGPVVVSMTMWPSSSRQYLEERFQHWGIELEFPGSHHVHHPQHWNHGHHRFGRPLPEQGRRGDTAPHDVHDHG